MPRGKAGIDPGLLEFIFSAHGLGMAPNVPGIDPQQWQAVEKPLQLHISLLFSWCSAHESPLLLFSLPEFQKSLAGPLLRSSLILLSLWESPTHSTKPSLFALLLWSAHW